MTTLSVSKFLYRITVALPSVVVFLLLGLAWVKDPSTDRGLFLLVPFVLVLVSLQVGEWIYIRDWETHFVYPRGLLPMAAMVAIDVATVVISLAFMTYVLFQDSGVVYFILASVLLAPVLRFAFLFGSMMIFDFGYSLRRNLTA